MNLGLVQLEFPSLVGVVAVENAASRHVLEKSEFTLERSGIFHGDEVVIYRSSIGCTLPDIGQDQKTVDPATTGFAEEADSGRLPAKLAFAGPI
jgi:hypothetical protein